jgi:hypothetical protein
MLAVLLILFFSLWLFFYPFILLGSLHGDLLGSFRGKGDDALENIAIGR